MSAQGAASRQQPPINLVDVANAEEIEASGILEDPQVQEALIPLLADGQQTETELREILRSPQLRGAFASLTSAVQSEGSFNSVMGNFGLDGNNPESMAALQRGDGVEAMLYALLNAARRRQQRQNQNPNPN